ncbi:MAG: DUF2461 domain-containing protein [Flavobacteriales bacterium]|nr:DUF2461 domain-containing protein [Flavobacteriales bacterium]
MKYFSKEFIQFYKDLAASNERDWFLVNKKRYEDHVKMPFVKFVSDVITAMTKLDKNMAIEPKDAIFRINRDIRFSKDKSPYKLYASAAIAPGGRKDMEYPGIYLELGPEKLALAGGAYMPSKLLLENIRTSIASNPAAFNKILADKDFVKQCGKLQGDVNKIIAPEFRSAAEKCPFIFNKQFYYWKELSPNIITGDGLLEKLVETYKASQILNKFLIKCL